MTADGSVVLMGAAGSRAGAEKLHVVPGEKEDRIELTGPTTFTHRGALEEGVELIQKPFVPQALLERLRQMLDNGGEDPT